MNKSSNYTASQPQFTQIQRMYKGQIPVTIEQVEIYRKLKAEGRTVMQIKALMKLGNARLVRVKDKSDYMASIES